MNLEDRFWSKVDKGNNDSCWNWTASTYTNGYGQFGVGGKNRLAHRVSYELSIGQISSGLQIDHLCRNRMCVNHKHLEAVTCKTNLLRGVGPTATNSQKTHCVHGHEFNVENTAVRNKKTRNKLYNIRICRTCERQADKIRYSTSEYRAARREKYKIRKSI